MIYQIFETMEFATPALSITRAKSLSPLKRLLSLHWFSTSKAYSVRPYDFRILSISIHEIQDVRQNQFWKSATTAFQTVTRIRFLGLWTKMQTADVRTTPVAKNYDYPSLSVWFGSYLSWGTRYQKVYQHLSISKYENIINILRPYCTYKGALQTFLIWCATLWNKSPG